MQDYGERLSIETPENLPLDAQIAGFGTRCTAAILDYLIIGALLILIALFFFNRVRDSSVALAVYIGIQFLLITFYHLLFELFWNGQSPGKRWTGLRVVRANGLPLTASAAVIRNFMRLFDFLPIAYGVGMIALFLTRNTQRLGDLAAGTIVIKEQKDITLTSLRDSTAVQYRHLSPLTPLPHYIQIDALTEQDRQLVVDFLNRRAALRDTYQIAMMLARQMAEKMRSDAPLNDILYSTRAAELFLEQTARAFELRQRETD